jgi:hypothetical protein
MTGSIHLAQSATFQRQHERRRKSNPFGAAPMEVAREIPHHPLAQQPTRETTMRLQNKIGLLTGAAAAIKNELMGFGGAAAHLFVR